MGPTATLHFSSTISVSDLVEAGVAIATLLLAGGTFSMARWTKKEAKAVAKQVRIGRKQIDVLAQQLAAANAQVKASTDAVHASIRPWLTAVRDQGSAEGQIYVDQIDDVGVETVIVALPLRNIGNGLAWVVDASLHGHWDRDRN